MSPACERERVETRARRQVDGKRRETGFIGMGKWRKESGDPGIFPPDHTKIT
jgi:hypothetical protein